MKTTEKNKLIDSFAVNTQNGNVYVYLINDPYKRKQLKSFLTFSNTKRYYVGSEKNKIIFTNPEDIKAIENYLES